MNLRKNLLILTACTLVVALPSPLFAAKGAKRANKPDPAGKAARPGMLLKKYDTDSNGAIDGSETEALRKAFDADKTGPLQKLDSNSDGTLDDTEIAAIKAHHGKGKGAGAKAGKRKKKNA